LVFLIQPVDLHFPQLDPYSALYLQKAHLSWQTQIS